MRRAGRRVIGGELGVVRLLVVGDLDGVGCRLRLLECLGHDERERPAGVGNDVVLQQQEPGVRAEEVARLAG